MEAVIDYFDATILIPKDGISDVYYLHKTAFVYFLN